MLEETFETNDCVGWHFVERVAQMGSSLLLAGRTIPLVFVIKHTLLAVLVFEAVLESNRWHQG